MLLLLKLHTRASKKFCIFHDIQEKWLEHNKIPFTALVLNLTKTCGIRLVKTSFRFTALYSWLLKQKNSASLSENTSFCKLSISDSQFLDQNGTAVSCNFFARTMMQQFIFIITRREIFSYFIALLKTLDKSSPFRNNSKRSHR